MSRVVVTVMAPSGRRDLAVPDDVPLEDLLPEIAEACAERPSWSWALVPRGGGPLTLERTLAESGIWHGSLLSLQQQQRPRRRPAAPPRVEVLAAAAPPRLPAPAAGRLPPALRIPDPAARDEAPPPVDLVVLSGPAAGRRVPLRPGEHRVGGHRYSGVVLDDAALAGVHLVATVHPTGAVGVADAGSGPGCRLDGAWLAGPVEVRPGQVLAAGRSLLTFAPHGAAAPEPEPAEPVGGHGSLRLGPPPAGPAGAWLTALGAGAGTAAAGLLGLAGTGWVPGALLLLGLSPLAAAGSLWWSRRDFRRSRAGYRRHLAQLEQGLAAARAAEAARLRAGAPDPAAVLARARGDAPGRWERRDDRLLLRLGWADRPFGVSLDPGTGGDARLRREAGRLAARHGLLHDVPVSVSLEDCGVLGVAGDPEAVEAVARWLVVQLAVLHPPERLALAAALPGEDGRWSWLRALPHCRAGTSLPDPFGERQAARTVVLLHEGAGAPADAVRTLLARGPARGVHTICLTHAAGELLERCGAVLEVPAGPALPTLTIPALGASGPLGGADGISEELAREAAGALSGGSGGEARTSVRLAALLRLGDDPERRVLEHWIRDRSSAGRELVAAVGASQGGARYDLRLRRDGPHVLLTGGAAGDRGEVLRTIVLSLAARHSPRTLALLPLGPALVVCAGLPHVVAGGLEAELRRRDSALREAGARDVAELEARLPGGAPPSLVVAVDGAAAEAAEVLAEAVRRGRELDVHVVTTEPISGATALQVRLAELSPAREPDPARLVEAIAAVGRKLAAGAPARR